MIWHTHSPEKIETSDSDSESKKSKAAATATAAAPTTTAAADGEDQGAAKRRRVEADSASSAVPASAAATTQVTDSAASMALTGAQVLNRIITILDERVKEPSAKAHTDVVMTVASLMGGTGATASASSSSAMDIGTAAPHVEDEEEREAARWGRRRRAELMEGLSGGYAVEIGLDRSDLPDDPTAPAAAKSNDGNRRGAPPQTSDMDRNRHLQIEKLLAATSIDTALPSAIATAAAASASTEGASASNPSKSDRQFASPVEEMAFLRSENERLRRELAALAGSARSTSAGTGSGSGNPTFASTSVSAGGPVTAQTVFGLPSDAQPLAQKPVVEMAYHFMSRNFRRQTDHQMQRAEWEPPRTNSTSDSKAGSAAAATTPYGQVQYFQTFCLDKVGIRNLDPNHSAVSYDTPHYEGAVNAVPLPIKDIDKSSCPAAAPPPAYPASTHFSFVLFELRS